MNKPVYVVFENKDEMKVIFSTEKKAIAYIKRWKNRKLHYEVITVF